MTFIPSTMPTFRLPMKYWKKLQQLEFPMQAIDRNWFYVGCDYDDEYWPTICAIHNEHNPEE